MARRRARSVGLSQERVAGGWSDAARRRRRDPAARRALAEGHRRPARHRRAGGARVRASAGRRPGPRDRRSDSSGPEPHRRANRRLPAGLAGVGDVRLRRLCDWQPRLCRLLPAVRTPVQSGGRRLCRSRRADAWNRRERHRRHERLSRGAVPGRTGAPHRTSHRGFATDESDCRHLHHRPAARRGRPPPARSGRAGGRAPVLRGAPGAPGAESAARRRPRRGRRDHLRPRHAVTRACFPRISRPAWPTTSPAIPVRSSCSSPICSPTRRRRTPTPFRSSTARSSI